MTARIIFGIILVTVCPAAIVLDRIAVTVGNDAITESEVLEELRITAFLNGTLLDFGPEARRAAAERLVDQDLIRREMKASHYLAPEAKLAEQMLENFKKSHFRSEAEFQEALRRYGITAGQVKAHLLWELAALRFTDLRFDSHPNLASETFRRQMEQHIVRLSQEEALKDSTEAESRARVNPQQRTANPFAPQTDSTPAPSNLAPNNPAAGNVDQQLDGWLKEIRSQVQIQFRKEAFQ